MTTFIYAISLRYAKLGRTVVKSFNLSLGISYFPTLGVLQFHNSTEKLTPAEQCVLNKLLESLSAIVTTDVLLDSLYPENYDVGSIARLQNVISHLRKKLVSVSCDENARNLISTAQRRGYVIHHASSQTDVLPSSPSTLVDTPDTDDKLLLKQLASDLRQTKLEICSRFSDSSGVSLSEEELKEIQRLDEIASLIERLSKEEHKG